MDRFGYFEEISKFCEDDESYILGKLVARHEFVLQEQQRNAWKYQIRYLRNWLVGIQGHIIFEYTIPRIGKRIDCVIISGAVVFAIEFKIDASSYDTCDINQVMDYALDLKNFHEKSHASYIVPILISTQAVVEYLQFDWFEDGISTPVKSNGTSLAKIISEVRQSIEKHTIDPYEWVNSPYRPTPTIIEAAVVLYQKHSVEQISRSEAGTINLTKTTKAILEIIEYSKANYQKSICFLTGVPGAGKTLAGLNLANSSRNDDASEHAVFLSGNGPLVEVLREALIRNDVTTSLNKGDKKKKNTSKREIDGFIKNIHHFRDDGLTNSLPPSENVVVFDEAQRAWSLKQTAAFMKKKKGIFNFNQSEPEFLISFMDRHEDWATIICLVGGGQEINTGEAGIQEWFQALERSFPHWSIYVSPNLSDQEYSQGRALFQNLSQNKTHLNDDLHLAVSIRSFRSEKVAAFVKAMLDCEIESAKDELKEVMINYPIAITRDLSKAKKWLKQKARGSERYGLIASSGAIRLKPHGINVKCGIDPAVWFLNGAKDVRSSYYLEDVATEFDIQGLELDWACVAWDGDLRYNGTEWEFKEFRGTSWNNMKAHESRLYLKNAYRVLLTRARQGMVIFVPYGDENDGTRLPSYYDRTFRYLVSLGMKNLDI